MVGCWDGWTDGTDRRTVVCPTDGVNQRKGIFRHGVNCNLLSMCLMKTKLCTVAGCHWLCWSWNYTRSKGRETSNASLM